MFWTGATGGVGKRVVEVLLQQGKAVRALVRDEGKGRKMLVRQQQTSAPSQSTSEVGCYSHSVAKAVYGRLLCSNKR